MSLAFAPTARDVAPHLHLEAASRTDRGQLRGRNEDAVAARPDLGLLVVADGMGGRHAGEVASRMAVDTICEVLGGAQPEPSGTLTFSRLDPSRIKHAILRANARIFSAAHASTGTDGMGTTVVAALAVGARVVVAHVGDSRAYLWRNGVLQRLTVDHTVESEYRAGAFRHLDLAKLDGQWHALTRAVGTKQTIEVDLRFVMPERGDVLLLCSDGLTRQVSGDVIAAVLLEHHDLDAAAEVLVTLANDAGGMDNTSVALGRWSLRDGRHG